MKTPFLPTLIGSGFGSGFSPFAPGTAGALLATLVWFAGAHLLAPDVMWWTTAALVVVFYVAGVWAAGRLQPYWGKDPSRVVVDEMVGVWIALLGAPPGHLWYGIGAFALFRLFDIVKPFGIRRMEQLPAGVGVMMDDVLAGVYSSLLIIAVRWLMILT